jgi:hypothetical protein
MPTTTGLIRAAAERGHAGSHSAALRSPAPPSRLGLDTPGEESQSVRQTGAVSSTSRSRCRGAASSSLTRRRDFDALQRDRLIAIRPGNPTDIDG